MAESAAQSDPSQWVAFIHNLEPDDFWIWTVGLLGAGLACGYGLFYFMRRVRIIEDTPTSKIRSAHQGYVELIGNVRYLSQQPVFAPLTAQACAWYHYKIEKREVIYTNKGSYTRWRSIKEQSSDRVFVCVDDTGMCMVDPRGAEVYCEYERIWYGEHEWPAMGPGGANTRLFDTNDYRYTERCLRENEPLYAIGNFRTVDPNKAHGDIKDEVGAILKIWKQDQASLLAKFDSNGDGQIDLQEWESVRLAAEKKAHEQRLSRADRPAVSILTKTDDFRRPYILSVKPPQRIIKHFRLKAAGCALGSILLTPMAIWMIFTRLSL